MLYLVGKRTKRLLSATLTAPGLYTDFFGRCPLALAHSPEPHDLYVVYGSGTAGCKDEWSTPARTAFIHQWLRSSTTPTVWFRRHRPVTFNLFLSPSLKPPRFRGRCDSLAGWPHRHGPKEPRTQILTWDAAHWLGPSSNALPNVAYFEFISNLGAETRDTVDDPTLAWGVNPSVLRQAWECANSEVVEYQQAGQAMYEHIANLVGDKSSLTAWTHQP